ncbi:HAD-IA family hydrolase [Pseudolysinimonas yzui]|uniref:Haloacid dehalogenase n=1 Tax=Pseudolysinimonas yzui TaxID=2708254 RepID=A0A8J3GNG5_9MICO|nr:HAD-IA family hydrolase [Pseudolysinimonas yzui]GHF07115.1 haloacid dehalogenase [Pseudolysinimonas yzui]
MGLLFVFDMDDVLYDYDWRHRMTGLTALTGLDFPELRRRWWHDEGEWAAEAGRWPDGASYLADWSAAVGASVTAEEWLANRASAMTPRPEALAAVARAAELGRVTLLTNNGPLVGENLTTLAPELVPLFGSEHLKASSHYGARKPDPRVFEGVLRAYDEPAEHTFFADDMPINVEGARSVGITAHLYRDPAALLNAIEDFAEGRRELAS